MGAWEDWDDDLNSYSGNDDFYYKIIVRNSAREHKKKTKNYEFQKVKIYPPNPPILPNNHNQG